MKFLYPITAASLISASLISCNQEDPLAERTQKLEKQESAILDRESSLTEKIKQLDQDRLELEHRIKKNTAQHHQASTQLERNNSAVKLQLADIADTQKELGSMQQSAKAKMLLLQQQQDSLEVSENQLAKKLHETLMEKKAAQKAKDEATTYFNHTKQKELQAQKAQLEAQRLVRSQRKLAKDYNQLCITYDNLKKNHDSTAGQYHELVGRYNDLARSHETLERDVQNLIRLRRELKRAKNDNVRYCNEIDSLKHSNRRHISLISQLRNQQNNSKEIAKRLLGATQQNAQLKQRNNKEFLINRTLRQQVQNLQRQVNQLKSK